MKKLLVASIIAVSSFAQAQEGKDQLRIEISVRLNQVYKQSTSDMFRGEKVASATQLKITGSSKSGEVVNYDSGKVISEQVSISELRIIDNSTIEMKSLLKGTSNTVRAEISESSILVPSSEVSAVVAADLKKQGQDLINVMRLESEDGKLDFQTEISDMNCTRSGSTLACDLSAKVLLDVVSK